MPDMSQYYDALRNADAAGDHAAATQLADYIHSVESAGGGAGTSSAPQMDTSKETAASAQSAQSSNGGSGDDQSPKTLAQRAKEIGIQTGIGAGLGALAPELLTGAAIVAAPIPVVGEVAAPILGGMAAAARAARIASAAYGAAGGFSGEVAGQATEMLNGSKGTADAARFIGGLAGPAVPEFAEGTIHGAYGLIRKILQSGFDGNESQKAVQAAKTVLRGSEESGVPQHLLHSALQQSAEKDLQAAQQAGDKTYSDAVKKAGDIAQQDSAAADKIIQDGKVQAQQIRAQAAQRAQKLNDISGGRTATATAILKQSDPALNRIGQPQELSDIGTNMRDAIAAKHQEALNARQSAYQNAVQERDQIVQAKEASGQTLDQIPEMKSLKDYINSKTLGSAAARKSAGGLAPVTEPGILRAYDTVKDAINNRRVLTGMDENGQPSYQTFKTSFEALDQVRRKLGEVVAGKEAEGYNAITKGVATQLYDRISKVQEAFVGNSADGRNIQRELQQTYHEASQGVKKFGVGAGGKATAVDRIDPERFAQDPQGIPKNFFSSRQSIQDLKELVQNPQLVKDSAHNYTARSLQGMNSAQVSSWLQKNSDWIREVPGLRQSVEGYQQQLSKIERVADKAGRSAEAMQKQAVAARVGGEAASQQELQDTRSLARKSAEGSVQTQQRVLDQGQKDAEAIRKQLAAAPEGLQRILTGGEGPEAIRNLLMNGKPEQTRLAARYLSQSPQGKQALEQSVRQLTATMSEKQLQQQWSERILPMLRDGKMISPQRLEALKSDVESVLKAYNGKTRLTLVQRHIIGALGSAGPGYFGGTGQ